MAIFEPGVERQSYLTDIFFLQLQCILVPYDEFDRTYPVSKGEIDGKIKGSIFS